MSDLDPTTQPPMQDQRRAEELADMADAEEVRPANSLWSDAWRDLRGNWVFWVAAVVITIMLAMAFVPDLFLFFYTGDPNVEMGRCNLAYSMQNPNAPNLGRPSSTNWFGFDVQGCDYYVRSILGARISIWVGLIVTSGALVLSLVFGSIAGYFGGIWDTIIARITDVWFAIPTLLGAIVILSVMRNRGMWQVILVLTVLGWPAMLRLMRSQVLSVKQADYVLASRSLGASDLRLIVRHIIPNGIAPVMVYATISIGVIISAEASLSFLGVGVSLPAISWGLMINTASAQIVNAPHLLIFPGLFLMVTVFSFILMGDVLRDAFDPKNR